MLTEENEARLQALRAGIRGSQLIADALVEKPEAGQEPSTLATARKSFETALWWIERSRGGSHDAT